MNQNYVIQTVPRNKNKILKLQDVFANKILNMNIANVQYVMRMIKEIIIIWLVFVRELI
jgi:hypothetical protein